MTVQSNHRRLNLSVNVQQEVYMGLDGPSRRIIVQPEEQPAEQPATEPAPAEPAPDREPEKVPA